MMMIHIYILDHDINVERKIFGEYHTLIKKLRHYLLKKLRYYRGYFFLNTVECDLRYLTLYIKL